MNRLTLMQTQSQVPIRYFKSGTVLEAANSSLHTAPHSFLDSSIAKASDSCCHSPTPSPALQKCVRALVSNASTNTDSTSRSNVPNAISTSPAQDHECLMLVTIRSDCVADLRHLVMRTCGELVVFISTQPIAHATKMKVWLCLSEAATDTVMDAVMHSLPSAEFGQITHS